MLALSAESLRPNNLYLLICGRSMIVYYGEGYEGPHRHEEDATGPLRLLIDELLSLNGFKHYRIRETGFGRLHE